MAADLLPSRPIHFTIHKTTKVKNMSNVPPLILAIDTSCDDTSAAVSQGSKILSNVVASQTKLHAPYGGVFPTVAKLAHREKIEPVVNMALDQAGVSWASIAAIAVTQGPGLAPALEVGIAYAQQLAKQHHLPLIAVNHIEGHALSALASPTNTEPPPVEQVLAVVISGGHSEFILIKQLGQYQRLGWKIDDAAGEVLDKIGRLIGLDYPAGEQIEYLAASGNPKAYPFPLPMTNRTDYHLSFAGLKTYARNLYEKISHEKPLTETQKSDFCASFQYSIFRAICYKLNKILQKYEVKQIWLGGGVAANQELRRMINEVITDFNHHQNQFTTNQTYSIPALKIPYTQSLCVDNAAMIGVVAGFQLAKHQTWSSSAPLERQPRLVIAQNILKPTEIKTSD